MMGLRGEKETKMGMKEHEGKVLAVLARTLAVKGSNV
jgi:hypothetical protein